MASKRVAGMRHNLPAWPSSFVGRASECKEVVHLLARTRLLTLTGAGGIGKTRLALQAAADVLADNHADVWFVELGSLDNPALVATATAAALGVREGPDRPLLRTLADTLVSRNTLLLLDNCEHLLEACASMVDTLLRSCPRLHVLATSREPLATEGEVAWRLPSLQGPDEYWSPSAKAAVNYEAVRLFVERASAAESTFSLSDENAATVALICRRLDGIPLAIELAAARVRLLSVAEIEARLDDCFALLTGGSRTAPARQRTLRATIDWSYELLAHAARELFGRLSVFAGGWTLEAAEEVCSGDGILRDQVLDVLSRLVDASMVSVVSDPDRASVRYGLLETLRQYGVERLALSDSDVVRGRHAAYYLTLIERAETDLLGGPRQMAWLARIDREHDNFRVALRWLEECGDVEGAQRLAGVLYRYWFQRGYLAEGRARLDALLALPGGDRRTLARAKVLNGAGTLAFFQGDYRAADRLHHDGLDAARVLGAVPEIAWSLYRIGETERVLGNWTAARHTYAQSISLWQSINADVMEGLCLVGAATAAFADRDDATAVAEGERALALFTASGSARGVARALERLGLFRYQRGELEHARAMLEQSLEICRREGHPDGTAVALSMLARLDIDARMLPAAANRLAEALQIRRTTAALYGAAVVVEEIAALTGARGRAELSLRLAGATAALRDSLGIPADSWDQEWLDGYLEIARRALGGKASDHWAAGRVLAWEIAVALARAEVSARQPPAGANGAPFELTPRESEVLRLLANGRRNAEIAAALLLSPRTVERHITNLYAKIGARGKADATAYALRHNLA